MPTITIPNEILKENELIIIPRREYEEILHLRQTIKNKGAEELDTDLALKIYREEKKRGKLETINSLADLD